MRALLYRRVCNSENLNVFLKMSLLLLLRNECSIMPRVLLTFHMLLRRSNADGLCLLTFNKLIVSTDISH